MHWTKEKPKECGWYFVSTVFNKSEPDKNRWIEVVEVLLCKKDDRVRLGFWDTWKNFTPEGKHCYRAFTFIDECDYEFSSEPIAEPKEIKE